MAGSSSIEWTDATWNPTTGCDRVSPGCDNCYALRLAKRLKAMGVRQYQRDGDPRTSGPGFQLTVHPGLVNAPLLWREPRRVFVNSMSDLFHKHVPTPWLADIFAVMAAAPKHTFQVLTKRHARLGLLGDPEFIASVRDRAGGKGADPRVWTWPLRNVWLGVSVESQQWANIRIPALVATPAAVRFVSAEPLLGPVDLDRWLRPTPGCGHVADDGCCAHPAAPHAPECHIGVTCPLGDWRGIDWVIAGGESGPGARPMHPDWVRRLRDHCTGAGVAFFFKQWGAWRPAAAGDPVHRRQWVGFDLLSRPNTVAPAEMARIGKHATGRLLDGRTWDEFPCPPAEGEVR